MCDKEAFYYVPRGWDYKEIKTRCGSTTYQNGHDANQEQPDIEKHQ